MQYIGPVTPTSWPGGPLMPVMSTPHSSSEFANDDDHAFVPPFSVVVGCASDDILSDGFLRVTACAHVAKAHSAKSNLTHVVGVAFEGVPDPINGAGGEFGIATFGPATVSYPYDELLRGSGAPAQIGDIISAKIDESVGFRVRGDPAAFSRLKLIAETTASIDHQKFKIVGQLIAWSAQQHEAQITINLFSPAQRARLAEPALSAPDVVTVPGKGSTASMIDISGPMADVSTSMDTYNDGMCDHGCANPCVDIIQQLIPAKAGMTNRDMANMLSCIAATAQPLHSANLPIYSSWLRQHCGDQPGGCSGPMPRVGLTFDTTGRTMCIEPTYTECNDLVTPACALLCAINPVCDMHDRAEQLNYAQYMAGVEDYLASNGSTEAKSNFKACLPGRKKEAFVVCNGHMYDIISLPPSAMGLLPKINLACPCDVYGSPLFCCQAAGPRFNGRDLLAENNIRAFYRSLLKRCNAGGGVSGPPSDWSAGEKQECINLLRRAAAMCC